MATELYLGIMSGTSLDGVDLALMDFSSQPRLLASGFTPMPAELRIALGELVKKGEASLQQFGEIDHRLGLLYAESVNQFLAEQQLYPEQITAIGCHGQTVWHAPVGNFPFTTQIGDMHLLAAKTGITVVGDFRRKDMAYGGQGAPLVPAFHQDVFGEPTSIVGVLNIGGISNISLIVPNQPTIGYDIGAGNTLLDVWIEREKGLRYDKDAEWAKSGKVSQELLASLLDEPFFQQPPPKSTGRELFNLTWLLQKIAQNSPLAAEDVQATLVEFTAKSVANDLAKISNPQNLPKKLLVCGGGARNPLLMSCLQALCSDWQVCTTDEYGLSADDVEAAAFAWLAYRRMHNQPSNMPSVTGATQAVSLGAIFTP